MAFEWTQLLPQDETSGGSISFVNHNHNQCEIQEPTPNAHVITWGSSHFSSSDRSIETLHVSGNDIVLEQSTNPNGSTELSPSQFLVNHVAQSQHGVHDGAVDSVTRTMAPPTTKRKRKAPTLRSDAWTPIKARIYELHVAQNTPLSEVKDIVEKEYEAIGFSAT